MFKVPLGKFETLKVQMPSEDDPERPVAKAPTHAEMLVLMVRSHDGGGFDFALMERVMRIAGRIEKAAAAGDDHVLLEEADFRHLKKRCETFKFATAHDELLSFVKAVTGAQEVEVRAAEN